MSEPLEVKTSGTHYYPVLTGERLEDEVRSWFAMNEQTSRAVAVIDANVSRLHKITYQKLFDGIFDSVEWFEVPSGEKEKNLKNWQALVDFALRNSVRRNTPVLAIGGGVTGDLAGFAASAVMRGLPLYHFPTTLLAMVDSAVGGKTGVNHETGKNLIGAFYQPEAVFVETGILETLPRKEWLCGLGEVIKYAAIRNPSLFEQSVQLVSSPKWHRHPELGAIIRECIAIKAGIVEEDEKESGVRAHLNLGHTFAHALEAYTGYKAFSHGEAVYVGLLAAAYLSNLNGAGLDLVKLTVFKEHYGLATRQYADSIPDIVQYMFKDKKILSNKIRLVLLKNWGVPYISDSEDQKLIADSWKFALETADCN